MTCVIGSFFPYFNINVFVQHKKTHCGAAAGGKVTEEEEEIYFYCSGVSLWIEIFWKTPENIKMYTHLFTCKQFSKNNLPQRGPDVCFGRVHSALVRITFGLSKQNQEAEWLILTKITSTMLLLLGNQMYFNTADWVYFTC